MGLKPEYLSFNMLLNQRLFSIPNYQRAYCWETKQREDLFEDIEKLHRSKDKSRHHFMATLVCLKTNKQEEYGTDILDRLDVVDGQQRLTTLIIILKAIAKQLIAGNESDKEEAIKRY